MLPSHPIEAIILRMTTHDAEPLGVGGGGCVEVVVKADVPAWC
jgi:hypothetical protein